MIDKHILLTSFFEIIGDMDTFEKKGDKYTDGWKFTCGLRQLESCVVYSLGSCGNM